MTGLQMLLKQVGLEPDRVQAVFNQFTNQIPAYLNALGQKVIEIQTGISTIQTKQDDRLAKIEANQRAIMAALDIEVIEDDPNNTAVQKYTGEPSTTGPANDR